MASLGRLWVGTSVGLILAYPLPRLRDGIPRIQERPQVALHGHSGPVSFLVPVQYGPLTGSPIRRRPESVLKKYRVEDSVIKHLPKMDKTKSPVRFSPTKQKSISPDRQSVTSDNIYEEIGQRNSAAEAEAKKLEQDSFYESLSEITETTTGKVIKEDEVDNTKVAEATVESPSNVNELSGEHTYFVLEPETPRVKMSLEDNSHMGQSETKGHDNGTVERGAEQSFFSASQEVCASNDLDKSNNVSNRFSTSEIIKTGVMDELSKKVKKRRSLDDLTDRDTNQDNVAILYPTLARPKTMGHNFQDDQMYMRTGMINAISVRRPDYSSLKHSSSDISVSSKKEEDFSKKKRSSVSFNEDTKAAESKRKISVGSSFVAGVDTLRKQDSNTILVLSGGDGYKDWKKRQSLPNFRPEEPVLIFWMYKF